MILRKKDIAKLGSGWMPFADAASEGLPMGQLLYLPLTSSKVVDWVALLSPEGDVVGYAPVDGFD